MDESIRALFERGEHGQAALECAELDLPWAAPPRLEALLLHGSPAPHPEDALLAQFARWLIARGASAAQRRESLELLREAIEQLGGLDVPFERLSLPRLMRDAPASAERAYELVAFLSASRRLSPRARRSLERQLARVRLAPVRRPAPERPLAA